MKDNMSGKKNEKKYLEKWNFNLEKISQSVDMA